MTAESTGRRALLVVFLAMLATGGIVALFFFAQSTLQITSGDRPQVLAEMDGIRRRFGNTAPCLDREATSADMPASAATSPASVHLLIWDADHQVVRATAPYWALRASAWKVRATRSLFPVLDYVTVDQIAGCGRGVLIDRAGSDGRRLLIWAE